MSPPWPITPSSPTILSFSTYPPTTRSPAKSLYIVSWFKFVANIITDNGNGKTSKKILGECSLDLTPFGLQPTETYNLPIRQQLKFLRSKDGNEITVGNSFFTKESSYPHSKLSMKKMFLFIWKNFKPKKSKKMSTLSNCLILIPSSILSGESDSKSAKPWTSLITTE